VLRVRAAQKPAAFQRCHPFQPRSKSVGLLRALHIEGLPLTMSASKLSELMSAYGPVQYAEVSICVGVVWQQQQQQQQQQQ
jgi:hypothetical protein